MSPRPCNVLMIYPRFGAGTFWNFAAACELFGAKYPTAPLGLITVAALLPAEWTIRLIDRNIETLPDGDLEWADLVMTGGMLPQYFDTIEIIELCRAHGKPVVVGGPGVSSIPYGYSKANFQVLGEAEGIIDKFIAAWEAGAREGVFEAEKFKIDVSKSPIPRFDLLKFKHYLYIGVQFSRGCPFTCEFCDIIELYGRVPRAKTNAQMLDELAALHRLGYRGHVDFVDDNLIGNKKAVKAFLPELKTWLGQHDYPFEFTTEASLNLSDDADLLRLMNEANFIGVFIGIESPDTDTLIAMRKKQNTRRNIAHSIHRILCGRALRHRRLHCRLRQREGIGRRPAHRADRRGRYSDLHGRSTFCPAQHPTDPPARQRGPPPRRTAVGSRRRHRSSDARFKLRHAATATGNPGRFQTGP